MNGIFLIEKGQWLNRQQYKTGCAVKLFTPQKVLSDMFVAHG